MEIQNLPSLQSIFSRMRELESLTSNPSQVLSFPEILEKEWNKQKSPQEREKLPTVQKVEKTLEMPRMGQSSNGLLSNPELISFIEKTAIAKGIDPNLVKAVIKTESGFNASAISPKGAMGLMQLMPSTADMLGVDDPMNPKENVQGGISYLSDMLQKFGDTEKALAAYNAGPGAVKKFNGVPPYTETQDYITKVKKNYKKFSSSI